MDLQKCTWPEVEDYLKESQTILIPIGSTEQHGPTGMIGTDSLSADAVARELGKRSNLMVAPVLSIGMATHHMAFAGTITLQPDTLILVIKDVVNSLATHGFEKFVFINGHGGNGASLKQAFEELDQECAFYNWYMGEETKKLRNALYGDQEGRHATPSEIALIQYLDIETVRDIEPDPICPPSHNYKNAKDMREKHPDGRIGANVSLANPADGKKLFEAALKDLISVIKE